MARLAPELDKSGDGGAASGGKKRRAEAAQRAAMDRMRASQRAAADLLMRFEDVEDDDDDDDGTQRAKGSNEALVCAICREEGGGHHLGFVGFAHQMPEIRAPATTQPGGPARPPLGWTFRAQPAAPAVRAHELEAWGMVDAAAATSTSTATMAPVAATAPMANEAQSSRAVAAADVNSSLRVHFCGHVIHSECKAGYLRMLAPPNHHALHNRTTSQFLCPLCKAPSNLWLRSQAESLNWAMPEDANERWNLGKLASHEPPVSFPAEDALTLADLCQAGEGFAGVVAGFAKSLGRRVEACLASPAGKADAYGELRKLAGKKEWTSMLALIRHWLPAFSAAEFVAFKAALQRMLHTGIEPTLIPWLCTSGYVLSVDPFVMLVSLLVATQSTTFSLCVAALLATRGTFMPDTPRLLGFLQRALVLVMMTAPVGALPAEEIEVNDAAVLWTVLRLGSSAALPRGVQDMAAAWTGFPIPKHVPQRLIALPQRFDALFAIVEPRALCFSKGKPITSPATMALCLLCGDVVCAGGECCRRGDGGLATQHAAACSKGTGVFLLVQRAEVLLMFHEQSVLMPAPYVDARGETDPGLQRGAPLHLDAALLEELQQLFADGRVPAKVMSTRALLSHVIRSGFF